MQVQRQTAAVSILLVAAGCTAEARSHRGATAGDRSLAPAGFWEHWGDGQAELSGYRLRQPRYGEVREGEAVLVVVTETFTHAQRVKSDGGHPDEYPVLKLNEVRDFQTGVYDYNVMTSAFLPLSGEVPRGLPARVSFSMQEWCGLTHADLIAQYALGHPIEGLQLRGSSYFDGEAQADRLLDAPAGGLVADAMPLLVRGLVGPLLAPGEQRAVPYLPRLADSRMQHRPLDWQQATLSRSAESEPVTVPAGTFSAHTVTLEVDGGQTWRWQVEDSPPHRLVRWTGPDGEEGALTGSTRLRYWEQHDNGHEALRETLGLPQPRWPE